MPHSANRLVGCALMLALPLTNACVYGDSYSRVKTTNLKLAAPKESLVAKRLDVKFSGTTVHRTITPMCVDMKSGTYTVIDESVRYHTGRGKGISLSLLGAGGLVGAYYAWDTVVQPLAYEALVFGAGFGVLGLVHLLAPGEVTSEDEAVEFSAATFNERQRWHTCGEPEVTSMYPLAIDVSGGSESWSFSSVGSSHFTLPDDLGVWAGACNVQVTVNVTVLDGANVFVSEGALQAARAARANIESRSKEHSPDKIRARFPSLVDKDDHIEIGYLAGENDGGTFAARSSWTFRVAPTNAVPRGNSDASRLARRCLEQKKAESDRIAAETRERCRAPKRDDFRTKCRPQCVFPEKTVRCDTSLEICLENTQGIEGPLSEGCRSEHQSCLSSVGQSSAAISSCIDDCMETAFGKVCP